MRKMRGVLALCMILSLASPLFAKDISITWEWDRTDEQVEAFRYQLNDQDPEKWTVVDSTVTSFTIGPVPDSDPQVLYVQQSFDGTLWSESGFLTYDPLEFGVFPQEPETATQAVPEALPEKTVITEELPAPEPLFSETTVEPTIIEVPEPEPVPETVPEIAVSEPMAVPEEPMPVRERQSRVELHIGAGGKLDNLLLSSSFDPNGDFVPLRTRVLPSVAVDYVRPKMWKLSSKLDLGLRAGLGFNGYESFGGVGIGGFDIHALAQLEFPLNEQFSFDAGLGLSFMFTGSDIQASASNDLGVFFGPVAQLAARYRIDDRWSVMVQAETRFLMGNTFVPYEMTGTVRLGVGYDF